MKTVLFLDNTYPKAYQSDTLKNEAIGGTEASVIRIAKILSKNYQVYVAQKNRDLATKESKTLKFIPKTDITKIQPNIIIVLRKYKLLRKMAKLFPQAQLFLWLHTYKNTEYVFLRAKLSKNKFSIICNSDTHRKHTNQLINTSIFGKIFSLFFANINVEFGYNPIPRPEIKTYSKDINKLIFFSSPNKGLKQVLDSFSKISKQLPQLKLYIANPGYKTEIFSPQEKTVVLGSLSHNEMMKHVCESLCVFYPQDTFAETFGLIYAEANANAVPVLAHNIGAAKEILDNNNQLIDVRNINEIINIIKHWQKNYPKIQYNEKFSDDNILEQWTNIIESNNHVSPSQVF